MNESTDIDFLKLLGGYSELAANGETGEGSVSTCGSRVGVKTGFWESDDSKVCVTCASSAEERAPAGIGISKGGKEGITGRSVGLCIDVVTASRGD